MGRRGYETLEACFEAHVFRADELGCWLWLGALSKKTRYGLLNYKDKNYLAHKVAYELYIEDIPSGLVLDHLCRVRFCCNPWHLEPVTTQINNLRGVGFAATNAAKTHCPAGHAYEENNVRLLRKGNGVLRGCKACHRIREAKRRARKAEVRLSQ